MAYIKNSKTTEAKTDLNAISKGAVSYFEAEHYSTDGMTATSKQYPAAGIGVKTLGAEPSSDTVGVKQSPISDANKASMNSSPWNDLKFILTSPFYYSYAYAADGQVTKTEEYEEGGVKKERTVIVPGAQQKSHFQATGCASLSSEKDSIFYINGYSDGTLSPVIEGTNTQCYQATVPSDPGTT